MMKSILKEYGVSWVINRSLYSVKLKMMSKIPAFDNLFEKKVDVKRLDIFNFKIERIKDFLIDLSPEKQAEIVAIADKAINGIIMGFSSVEMNYGNPINWHLNPITKKESNRHVKWYRIPDFDSKRGDIKVTWEASRFIHFLFFARAYLITGDNKYYAAFSEQLERWLKDNPYPYGANYKCGQECTLRMINALIVYAIFARHTTVEDEHNMRLLVEVCYKKVLSNFFYAYKCIKNNHTFTEICGLIVGSWCCDDKLGLKKAYELLDKETKSQFLSDGGYTQYSFNYQRFTIQMFECILKISERTGISISPKSRELIKKSTILMYQAQDITGDVPNYGSNDGALIFPLAACDYRDFRPALNALYALTTGERLYAAGDYDEELLWFGDGKEFPVKEVERKSTAFSNSGFYTLRHEGGFLMTYLQGYKARPSHMDGLHIDLWHEGKNIFCDRGTYSYSSELLKEIATTAGHNTVKVTGVEQMNKHGPFFTYDWTECRDVKHGENCFSGTLISKNGYEHTRKIMRTEQGYEIADEVRCNDEQCECYFHTPYEVENVPNGFNIWVSDRLLCTVIVEYGDNIEVSKVYSSLYYLKKEEINRVTVRFGLNNKKAKIKFKIKLNK